MDLTDFPDSCFDLIVDKALLDSLLSMEVETSFEYLLEMQRVLKPGGILLIISHGSPETRSMYLTDWNIDITTIPKPILPNFEDTGLHDTYFIYECRLKRDV